MITGELPSKYNNKFEHFLQKRKTIAIVNQIFVNIEDKHSKIEYSAKEDTLVD